MRSKILICAILFSYAMGGCSYPIPRYVPSQEANVQLKVTSVSTNNIFVHTSTFQSPETQCKSLLIGSTKYVDSHPVSDETVTTIPVNKEFFIQHETGYTNIDGLGLTTKFCKMNFAFTPEESHSYEIVAYSINSGGEACRVDFYDTNITLGTKKRFIPKTFPAKRCG